MSFPVRPVAALLGSLVSLCVGTSFAKTLFPQMGAEGISAYRIGLAALLLVLVLRPWRRRWQGTDLPPLALYGVILGAMNLLFYLSIGRIPLGLAIAVEFTGPLAVALWTSHRRLDLLWVALAATLVVLPVALAQSGSALFRLEWLWPGLVVAALSSALPYALEMYALRHLPTRSFSILLSLEPAVGAVAAWVMLSEALTPQQWLAIAFVMIASMGSAWSVRSAPARESGNPAPP